MPEQGPDILCVFGRGIEKVDGVWRPTAYIEKLSPENQHPGVRYPENTIDMDGDDPQVVIAGAEINALATATLFASWRAAGSPPKVVTFAAGRPRYIAEDPDPTLSEGRLLKEVFLREVEPIADGVEVVMQTTNRNTRDDLLKTLHLAKTRGFQRIVIVSVLVHVPRCMEFLRHALLAEPSFSNISVEFFASETVVLNHCSGYEFLYRAMISKAFARTAERERRGIADLQSGKYDFVSQGYAFAPK